MSMHSGRSGLQFLVLMDGVPMHAIVEQELLDYASNNVLKAFTVRETAEGVSH